MLDPKPVHLPAALLRELIDHCINERPLECCGVLGGLGRTASSIFRFTNILAAENRYEADPNEIIRSIQELRQRGEEFVAIYHSHPRWKAEPSRTDLERNGYGDLPQIIVGLLDKTPDVRAWRLNANSFDEIRLIVAVEETSEDG